MKNIKKKKKEESQFIYTTNQEMLHKSTCLGHRKWREMHYHANALFIRWHFGYESKARCNDWIPKSNPFRRFPHKKVALFLHKKLQRTQKSSFLYKSYRSYPGPIKNPWVSMNFKKIAKNMWKNNVKSLIFHQFSRGKGQHVEKSFPFTNALESSRPKTNSAQTKSPQNQLGPKPSRPKTNSAQNSLGLGLRDISSLFFSFLFSFSSFFFFFFFFHRLYYALGINFP